MKRVYLHRIALLAENNTTPARLADAAMRIYRGLPEGSDLSEKYADSVKMYLALAVRDAWGPRGVR